MQHVYRTTPRWLKDEVIEKLVADMHLKLDTSFPLITADDGHHYRREKNLKTFIARQMARAYKKGKN